MNGLPGLTTRYLGRHWIHLDTVGSTNDYCKEQGDKLPDGSAVTAAEQTAGKGRLGRTWTAPPDSCLALSVVLRDIPPERLGPLPLVAGIAVSEGVEADCGVSCDLKWSNDVLVGDKKLCGILCESRLTARGALVVVGMGVNLTQTEEAFQRLGLVYAASLRMATGKLFSPSQVAVSILNRLEPLLDQLLRDGFGSLLDRYRQRCVTLGRPVRVLGQGGEEAATALDVGEDGSLLCETGGAVRPVHAGEVSVRGLYGYN